MSIRIMTRVWGHSAQKGGELLVMLALADFANDDGECWPSIPVLAKKSRLSDRQTRRVLNTLQASGELRRSRSNGGRNRRSHYFITVTENPDKITVTELHCKNNTEIHDTKTLSPVTGALNRHRTANKSVEPNGSSSFPHSTKRKLTRPEPAVLAAFEQFYGAYPRRVGKAEAMKAWLKLAPAPAQVAEIMAGVKRYTETVKDNDPQFIKHPGPWLNARRWEDEPVNSTGPSRPRGLQEIPPP